MGLVRISTAPLGAAALLLAAGALALVPAAAAPPAPGSTPTLRAPAAFSPDGNGVADTAKVKFTLPAAGSATLQIKGSGLSTEKAPTVRIVRFGRLAAGRHVWRWDGRDQRGRRLPEGPYELRLNPWTDSYVPRDRIVLDTSFSAQVSPVERYAVSGRTAPVQVFPRTTVVRDGVDLRAVAEIGASGTVPRVRLVVEDSDGDVVLEREKAALDGPWLVRWTARRGGRALPPGDYTATVRGVDKWGNAGRSKPLPVRVSGRRLVWQEESRVLPAVAHQVHLCTFSAANGCGDPAPYGRVLPSERYAGGLSFRSLVGESVERSLASSVFYLPVPETAGVRGVDSARVSFAGSPTVDGETDLGHLALWAGTGTIGVSSSTGAGTEWAPDPYLAHGALASDPLPRFAPGVVWSFYTRGTDSVDVATFTVDLRYLLPE